jgi:tight adherence protein C
MARALRPELLLTILPWVAFVVLSSLVLLLSRWLLARPKLAPASQDLRNLTLDHRPIFGGLTPALAAMFPAWFPARLDRDLRRAGYYWPDARNDFLALRNALLAGGILSAGAWFVVLADEPGVPTWQVAAVGVMLTILVFSVPRMYVSYRAERRIERIMTGFPDALDMLVMALSGGMPLEQALDRVSAETASLYPELALELEIVRRQAYVSSLPQALQRLAERIDEETITALMTLASHAEQLGTDVSSVLVEYADQLRARSLERAEERGNRVSMQMLFPITLCLAPAVYVLLLAPPLLDLKDFRDRETRGNGILVRKALTRSAIRGSPRPAPGPPPSSKTGR